MPFPGVRRIACFLYPACLAGGARVLLDYPVPPQVINLLKYSLSGSRPPRRKPVPVIIIGADAPVGAAIAEAVAPAAAEVRVFISDQALSDEFKRRGAKVALGDVSDFSHVEAACLHCFCAIWVMEAAADERERAFAADPGTVFAGWARAAVAAQIKRAIWVGTGADHDLAPAPPPGSPMETARVVADSSRFGNVREVAEETARLEGARRLPDGY